MKTVFKKTLIATAALALVSTANAAVIRKDATEMLGATAGTSYVGSAEGLVVNETLVLGTDADVFIKPKVTNVEQDVLVITVSGAKFKTDTTPVLTVAGAQTGGYEFFDFQDANTIRFRVKSGGVPTTALAADHFELTGVTIDTTGVVAGGKITLASKVISLNAVIGEYDKASFDWVKVQAQTKLTLGDAFDQEIATAKSRREFTGDDLDAVTFNDTTTEVVQLTLATNNGTDLGTLPLTATENAKVTHVIAGDWSFLRDADKKDFGGDGNGTLTSAEIADLAAITITTAVGGNDTFAYSLSADSSKLTITQTAVGGVDTGLTLTVEPAAIDTPAKASSAVGLNPGKFTASVSAETDDSTFNVASNVDAGAWTIDGSVVKVPYLVLQEGRFGTVVTVSNSGSRTGEILLDIVDEAGLSIASSLNAGSSTPGSIVNVSGKIKDALAAKGKDLTKVNKFSVTVTTNVPENDVLVYSAYTDSQNGGERAIVNNDSKVQTK